MFKNIRPEGGNYVKNISVKLVDFFNTMSPNGGNVLRKFLPKGEELF